MRDHHFVLLVHAPTLTRMHEPSPLEYYNTGVG